MTKSEILDTKETVVGICELARKLNYHDSLRFGSLDSQNCLGDLVEFLNDNPGAINAMIEWTADAYGTDEEEDDEEEEYED